MPGHLSGANQEPHLPPQSLAQVHPVSYSLSLSLSLYHIHPWLSSPYSRVLASRPTAFRRSLQHTQPAMDDDDAEYMQGSEDEVRVRTKYISLSLIVCDRRTTTLIILTMRATRLGVQMLRICTTPRRVGIICYVSSYGFAHVYYRQEGRQS